MRWRWMGRAAIPDLAEAGHHGSPKQRKHGRDYENDVENELGVQLADTLPATFKRITVGGAGLTNLEVIVLVAVDSEHGRVARVSDGMLQKNTV